MADTVYLKVKNWKRFQQYKDGRPLRWIKLYVKLLGDYDFEQLPERTQLHLVKIWLVAAEQDNRIPCEPEWIARQIAAKSDVDVLTMVEEGWLGVHSPHDVENVRNALSGGDVQFRTGQRTQRALARGEKRREEESSDVSSLRSSTSGPEPVEEQPREDNPWGPTVDACREHLWLGDDPPRARSVGEELSVAKQLEKKWKLDRGEIPAVVEAFGRLRDRGQFEGWIERGEPACLLAMNQVPDEANGIPVIVRCLHEYRKQGPSPPEKRRDGEPQRVGSML